jgi:hypothetical protein
MNKKKAIKKDLSASMPEPQAKAEYIRKGSAFKKADKTKLKLCGYYLDPESVKQLKELEIKLRRKASSIMQEALEDILTKHAS